jgi:hypothetical protein
VPSLMSLSSTLRPPGYKRCHLSFNSSGVIVPPAKRPPCEIRDNVSRTNYAHLAFKFRSSKVIHLLADRARGVLHGVDAEPHYSQLMSRLRTSSELDIYGSKFSSVE